jgi:hypothetical protein
VELIDEKEARLQRHRIPTVAYDPLCCLRVLKIVKQRRTHDNNLLTTTLVK